MFQFRLFTYTFLSTLFLLCGQLAFGQARTGVPKTTAPASQVRLYTLGEHITLSPDIASLTKVTLNTSTILYLRDQAPDSINFLLEVPGEGTLLVPMEKSKIIPANQIIKSTGGEQITDLDVGLHYISQLGDGKGPKVALSLFGKDSASAYIAGNLFVGIRAYNLGPRNKTADFVIFADNDLPEKNPFTCGNVDVQGLPHSDKGRLAPPLPTPQALPKTVKLFVEADFQTYRDNGLSIQQTVTYLNGIFNTSGLFYHDLGIPLELVEVYINRLPDNYPTSVPGGNAGVESGAVLDAFIDSLPKRQHHGDMAELVSTVRANQGGITDRIGGICQGVHSSVYSQIDLYYREDIPTYSWTIFAITHEMGHNLGSRHTQWCGWDKGNGIKGPLDSCYAVEREAPGIAKCYTGPVVPSYGSLMSYCHLTTGGIDFSKAFGPLPGAVIQNGYASATCLTPSTLPSLTSVTPVGAPYHPDAINSYITINGANLSKATGVFFGPSFQGWRGTIISSTDDYLLVSINADVPQTGLTYVTVNYLVGTSVVNTNALPFRVICPDFNRPVVAAGGALVLNPGQSVTLSLVSQVPAGYSIRWNNGATTPYITLVGGGSFSVKYSNGNNGCESVSSTPVVVQANVVPTPIITSLSPPVGAPEDALAINGELLGKAKAVHFGNTLIDITDPTGNFSISDNQILLNVPQFIATGTYDISLDVQVSASFTYTTNKLPFTVVCHALPATSIAANSSTLLNPGQSVKLYIENADGYYQHIWNNGSTADTIVVNNSGTYWAQATFGQAGCVGGRSNSIRVVTGVNPKPGPPVPVLTSVEPPSIGLMDFANSGILVRGRYLDNATSGLLAGTLPLTITSHTDTTLLLVPNGSTGLVSGPNSIEAVFVKSGLTDYSNALTFTILCPPIPTPAIVANGPLTFAAGGSVQLSIVDNVAEGHQVVWSDGQIGNPITVTSTGSYSVQLQQFSNGCVSAVSDTVSVLVNPSCLPVLSSLSSGSGLAGSLITVTGADLGCATTAYFGGLASGKQAPVQSVTSTSVQVVVPLSVDAGSSSVTLVSQDPSLTNYYSNSLPFTIDCPVIATPTIAPVGPISLWPSSSVTLTAPNGFTYLWSTGETTQSITVGQTGNYSVQTIVGSCTSAISAATVVTVLDCPMPANTPAGVLDNCFIVGAGFNDAVFAIAPQPDGKILASGFFTAYNGTPCNRICRINSDGSLDATFAPTGTGLDYHALTIALQPDGKIVVGGDMTAYNGIAQHFLCRLNADGTLDATFAQTGTGLSSTVRRLALQPDGKILVVGDFTSYDGTACIHICRLNTDGTLDATFAQTGTGLNNAVYDIALQPDGKILAGGSFTAYNGTNSSHICRLNGNGTLDGTFAQTGAGLDGDVFAIAL